MSSLFLLFVGAFFLQTIPGIPPVLVSGNNARPIIEVTNSIWRVSALLFLFLTVAGIWMSQFKFISERTGGPGQYLSRCLTVGVSLAGYKVIFAAIMWTGALIAFQIFPLAANPNKNTTIPWLPAGTISATSGSGNSTNTNSNSNTNTTGGGTGRTPFQITKNTSVLDMIGWGLKSAFQIAYQGMPSMIVITLCNIFFILGIFLITAFWVIFAVILYALGPLMIMAGLIPTYGDKLWSNWIGATIQCSLWQVWMAFCGKLITSSFLIQIEQLNPMNRVDGNTAGGEFSTVVMDLQQAAYALVFLMLYLATPFVSNYIFPLSSAGGLGAFLMGMTALAAKKATGAVKGVATAGPKGAALGGLKGVGSGAAGLAGGLASGGGASGGKGAGLPGAGTSATSDAGGSDVYQGGNSSGGGGQTTSVSYKSPDQNQNYSGETRSETQTAPTTGKSVSKRSTSDNGGGVSDLGGKSSVSDQSGRGGGSGTSETDEGLSSEKNARKVYTATKEPPPDVKFGKLPEPKKTSREQKTTSRTSEES